MKKPPEVQLLVQVSFLTLLRAMEQMVKSKSKHAALYERCRHKGYRRRLECVVNKLKELGID